jgi:outer membrane receptor protein involved in Fe transport
VPASGVGGRFEVRPPIGGTVELRLGIDGRRTEGETDEFFTYVAGQPTRMREAGGRTASAGAFADLSVGVGDATLTAGARIDRWSIEAGRLRERVIGTGAPVTTTDYPDRNGTEATARGGLAYKLGSGFSVRSAAYLGWRLPTLNELYRPFRAGVDATAANPALKPERVKGVDGGIDWSPVPGIRLGATIFHNVLDDAIGNITLGNGPGTFPGVGFVAAGGVFRQRGNLDAIRSNGAELEGRYTNGSWTATASYSLVDARVRGSGLSAPLDGLRPAQTPRNQLSGTIAYEHVQGFRASATLRYVDDQFEDDQNSRTLNHATTLDLTAGVPIGHNLTIEARAENVTNTRIEATIAADGTIERASPRTLWLGIRFGG